jgi:hypothetical protein
MLAGFAQILSRDNERDQHVADQLPNKQASAITEVLESASYFAEKAGRDQISAADIKAAIQIEFPSAFRGAAPPDSSLASDVAAISHDGCKPTAEAFQERSKTGSRLQPAGRHPATNSRRRIADFASADA